MPLTAVFTPVVPMNPVVPVVPVPPVVPAEATVVAVFEKTFFTVLPSVLVDVTAASEMRTRSRAYSVRSWASVSFHNLFNLFRIFVFNSHSLSALPIIFTR